MKMSGLVNRILLLQIAVCCTTGLTLSPVSDLTVQNFSLACDLTGAVWTSSLLFFYDGNSAGGCGFPPNPICASSIGSITTSNDQIATLTLSQSEILSKGNARWTCTHSGLLPGEYNATVIAVCSNGVVKQEDKKLDIRCSCGYPSVQANITYKDDEDIPVETIDLENSTSSGCADTRAMDFSYQISDLPNAAQVCVAFMTLSQLSASVETICLKLGSTNESTTYISTAEITMSTMLTETTSDTAVVSTEPVSSTSDTSSTSVASSSSGSTQSVGTSSESTQSVGTSSESTQSVGTSSEIASVATTTSDEGLSEELIIIISIGSSCGAILLLSVIIVIIVLCCRRKTDGKKSDKENHGNKLDKLHEKKASRKDLNSNTREQDMNWKYPEPRITRHGNLSPDYLPQRPNDAGYGSRMFSGYYNPGSFHHYPGTSGWRDYRKQNVAYYQPYTNRNDMMLYHSQYPGYSMGYRQSRHSEPYRVRQSKEAPYMEIYDQSMEERDRQRRGHYESSWETLY